MKDEELVEAVEAVAMLAFIGEKSGFPLKQMFDLLESGHSVATLLEIIDCRLAYKQPARRPGHWVA